MAMHRECFYSGFTPDATQLGTTHAQVLQHQLDEWMEEFDAREARKLAAVADAAADDGWTVVKRHKVRPTASPRFHPPIIKVWGGHVFESESTVLQSADRLCLPVKLRVCINV
jgi:hypothetical protein